MATWNNLPKELKWLIIEHLLMENTSFFYYQQQDLRSRWYFSKYAFFHKETKVIPSKLSMSGLLAALSLIDKQTRKLLQSKTRVCFKTSLDNVEHNVFKIIP